MFASAVTGSAAHREASRDAAQILRQIDKPDHALLRVRRENARDKHAVPAGPIYQLAAGQNGNPPATRGREQQPSRSRH